MATQPPPTKEKFRLSLNHAARTTVVALVSLLVARAFGLPEAYWSAVTTLVVMQSTLGAAWAVSWQRFAGTALGAAMATLLAAIFGANVVVFCAGVFLSGVICEIIRLDRSAYRFASITLTIVLLVARDKAIWIVAVHRFVEVTIGIMVGLVLTALWPEGEAMALAKINVLP